MAQRMTAESVAAEQHDIDRQHDRADADAERVLPRRIREPHRLPHIDARG